MYQSNNDFLNNWLSKLDLLIERALLIKNVSSVQSIVNQENEFFSNKIVKNSEDTTDNEQQIKRLTVEIAEKNALLQQNLLLTNKNGIFNPFLRLIELFNLTEIEQDILLICIAPYFDKQYSQLFGMLLDKKATVQPSLKLISYIFNRYSDTELMLYSLLTNSNLISWQLIHFLQPQNKSIYPIRTDNFTIDVLIVNYLFELNFDDAEFNRIILPINSNNAALNIDDELLTKIKNLIHYFQTSGTNNDKHLINFYGLDNNLIQNVITVICQLKSAGLYKLDASLLVNIIRGKKYNKQLIDLWLNRLCRSLLLHESYLVIAGCEIFDIKSEDDRYWIEYSVSYLLTSTYFLFLSSNTQLKFEHVAYDANAKYHNLHFTIPNSSLRYQIWQKMASTSPDLLKNLNCKIIAENFKFSEDQIHSVLNELSEIAILQNLNSLTEEKIFTVCRSRIQQSIENLAEHIFSDISFDDIVLPEKVHQQLYEISIRKKYKQQVLYDWQFVNKNSSKLGTRALFYGHSGTGKTMAALAIANELKLELYKIDLAMLTSKYIGETEKHLSRLFNQAEIMDVILFFDEADSLFGKRIEAKDAHDRYANLQTSYLLQRIETYPGIIILATNLLNNIDEAFTRRLDYIIEFPFPDADYRKRIWQKVFPKQAPLANEINFDLLAENLKLSAANIHNVAVRAAFYAAEEKTTIMMKHIILASKLEYDKLGSIFNENDFLPVINNDEAISHFI